MRSHIAGSLMLVIACAMALAQPGAPPEPKASVSLKDRQALAAPARQGFTHTGGGNIDVAQPAPDTVVITMTGVAVAVGGLCGAGVAGMDFVLSQDFEVSFEKPEVKAAKVTLEGRVLGLLRSHKHGGTAEATHGCAIVQAETAELLSLS